MNKSEAERILARIGYNYALSDVEEACAVLDHPELTEEDSANYHKWADPYPRRCYCSAIAYTDKGRVYAISLSDNVKKIHQKIFGTHYPDGSEVRDRCGEPYIKKKWRKSVQNVERNCGSGKCPSHTYMVPDDP